MSPAPPLLSRQQIVQAAITLLDREGVDAFSMRRLGALLGVDPMAVYHHLPNKAALFDAVVDWVWTGIALQDPEPGESWQDIAMRLVRALRAQLLGHPRLVPIIATRPLVTPAMLALVDRALLHLANAGLAPESAMQLLDCVVGFTVGKVQAGLRDPIGGPGTSPEQVYATLTADTHPQLFSAMQQGYGWAPDDEFERGLRAMIGGWAND